MAGARGITGVAKALGKKLDELHPTIEGYKAPRNVENRIPFRGSDAYAPYYDEVTLNEIYNQPDVNTILTQTDPQLWDDLLRGHGFPDEEIRNMTFEHTNRYTRALRDGTTDGMLDFPEFPVSLDPHTGDLVVEADDIDTILRVRGMTQALKAQGDTLSGQQQPFFLLWDEDMPLQGMDPKWQHSGKVVFKDVMGNELHKMDLENLGLPRDSDLYGRRGNFDDWDNEAVQAHRGQNEQMDLLIEEATDTPPVLSDEEYLDLRRQWDEGQMSDDERRAAQALAEEKNFENWELAFDEGFHLKTIKDDPSDPDVQAIWEFRSGRHDGAEAARVDGKILPKKMVYTSGWREGQPSKYAKAVELGLWEEGDDILQIKWSMMHNWTGLGRGYGKRMYGKMVEYAKANNLKLVSDASMSEEAGHMYHAMTRRGGEINDQRITNPENTFWEWSRWLGKRTRQWMTRDGTPVITVEKLPEKLPAAFLGLSALTQQEQVFANNSKYQGFFYDEDGDPYLFNGRSPFVTNVGKGASSQELAEAMLKYPSWEPQQKQELEMIASGRAGEGSEDHLYNILATRGFDHFLHKHHGDVSFRDESLALRRKTEDGS